MRLSQIHHQEIMRPEVLSSLLYVSAMVLNLGAFVPQGIFGNVWGYCGYPSLKESRVGATGI